MARLTLFSIFALSAQNTGVTATAAIVDPTKRDITFTAQLSYFDKNNTQRADQICNPNGSVKVYKDADSIMRDITNTLPSVNDVSVAVSVVALQKPLSLSVTPETLLGREKATLQRAIVKQTDIITKSTANIASIASFQTGSNAQQLFYAEQVARKTIAESSKSDMEARLVAVNALLLAAG